MFFILYNEIGCLAIFKENFRLVIIGFNQKSKDNHMCYDKIDV